MSSKKTVSLLVIALGLGVAGAGLSMLYLKAREADLIEALKPKSQPIEVVVAARDLVKGDKLDTSTLSVRSIPSDFVDPNAIKPDQFENIQGEVLTQNLAAGKPLLRSFIGREFPLDFSDTIPLKRRAMTIQIDETNSISGLIRPGNRIDIFVNLPPTAGGSNPAKTNEVMPVLENIEVLATGRDAARDYEEKVRLMRVGYGAKPDMNYTTLTLNVTAREAALLTIAKDKGDLLALLRNRKDNGGSGFTTVSTDTIKSNASKLAASAAARASASALGGSLKTDADGNIVTDSGVVLKGAKLREDGKIELADGTVVDPDDVVIAADGTVMKKDGTVLSGVTAAKTLGKLTTDENGNIVTANGAVIAGAKLNEDGKLVLPDGTVVDPNDVIINADGTISTKDGKVIDGLKSGTVAGKLKTDANGNIVTETGATIKGATLRSDGKLQLADGRIVDPKDVIINADGSVTDKDGNPIEGLVAENVTIPGAGYEVDYIVGGVSQDSVATVNKVPVTE
ncbi:MAG: Flp pilus assembly protein CpaB [Chromatiales bacterium]